MEQLTTFPRPGDPSVMEPWALSAWQSWTLGQGGEPRDIAPSIADTPAALQVREVSSQPQAGTDPEGAEAGLPSLRQQVGNSGRGCPRLEDEEVQALPKVRGLGKGWNL